MTELVVAFEPMKTVEILSLARSVSSALRDNPDFKEPWDNCPTSLAQLDEAIEHLQNAHTASLSGDHDKIELRKASHKALSKRLRNVAHLVQMISSGDVQMLRGSGFVLRKPGGKGPSIGLPAAPRFSVKHGERGTLIGSANRVGYGKGYELQVCTGDPTIEANWCGLGMYAQCSRILIEDREPGKVYSFRLRAIATSGPGPWSLPITIMAL